MIGQVIRESLGLYRRLFGPLVVASFLIFLPFTIALLALELVVPDTPRTQQGLAIIDAVGSVLLFAPLASIVIIRSAIALEQTPAHVPPGHAHAVETRGVVLISGLMVVL